MQASGEPFRLLSGDVFGAAVADSAQRFGTPLRLLHYEVSRFEECDLEFDSHLAAVSIHASPRRAFRRIDATRRDETILPYAPILIPRGATHDSVVPEGGAFIMLAVPEPVLRETAQMLGAGGDCTLVPTFPDRADDELAALMRQAALLVQAGDLSRSVELQTCLHRIVVRLVAAHSDRAPRGHTINRGLAAWQVQRVTDFVQAHVADTIQIDDLAALVGLSRHHFLRQFHRATGRTPGQFVIEHRLWLARALLGASRDPVSTIAARCGFTTEAHFAYTFRRRFGQPPSRVRCSGSELQ